MRHEWRRSLESDEIDQLQCRTSGNGDVVAARIECQFAAAGQDDFTH